MGWTYKKRSVLDRAIIVLDELKEKYPDTNVIIDLPDNKGSTFRIGDALIYDSPGGDLVFDAE